MSSRSSLTKVKYVLIIGLIILFIYYKLMLDFILSCRRCKIKKCVCDCQKNFCDYTPVAKTFAIATPISKGEKNFHKKTCDKALWPCRKLFLSQISRIIVLTCSSQHSLLSTKNSLGSYLFPSTLRRCGNYLRYSPSVWLCRHKCR